MVNTKLHGLFENHNRQNCCIGTNYVGIIGYADDLFLMSPTLDGLQKMLQICEDYAKDNLCFSTNSNPKKSKTKCMAFLQKKRDLNKLKMCGDLLPLVVIGKHVGTRIENEPDNILNQDTKEKRAHSTSNVNELMQEFSFAKVLLNLIKRLFLIVTLLARSCGICLVVKFQFGEMFKVYFRTSFFN